MRLSATAFLLFNARLAVPVCRLPKQSSRRINPLPFSRFPLSLASLELRSAAGRSMTFAAVDKLINEITSDLETHGQKEAVLLLKSLTAAAHGEALL